MGTAQYYRLQRWEKGKKYPNFAPVNGISV